MQNYYSNPYIPYTYYQNQVQQQMPQQQMYQQTQQQMQTQQQSVLNGKLVENEDIVKITEVPIGGFGVFPKADFSEIFVKTWTNEGSTKVIKYSQSVEINQNTEDNKIDSLCEKIDKLEQKITKMFE